MKELPYQSELSAGVADSLTEIIGIAVEHDLHQKPDQFITFIELYCTYLRSHSTQTGEGSSPVSFVDFVANQMLIDLAVSHILSFTGESVAAPLALKI